MSLSALRRAYPRIKLDDDTMVNRVAEIQAKALSRRPSDVEPTDAESLASALKKARTELVFYRELADHYEGLVDDLIGMLEKMAAEKQSIPRAQIRSVTQWARQKLKRRA